jgi:hypothetical protein
MTKKTERAEPANEKPRNKANMDQPQEEFVDLESAHVEHDREHGAEVKTTDASGPAK